MTIFLLVLYGVGAFFLGYSSNHIVEAVSIVAIILGGIGTARFIANHSR